MKNNYMNFEVFNEYQSIIEKRKNEFDSYEPINEAFDSSILRQLSSQESGSRWTNKFAKDFFKFSNIKLDKITNEDFIQISPAEWWSQGYSKNNQAIGFFVDDNPELFKSWDTRLQQRMDNEGKKLKLNKILKNAQGVGLVLTIMRGKVGMWYGFEQDAGTSGYRRYKKSPDQRYGVLADQWRTDSSYRYEGVPSPDAKITRKNLELVATKVYVLDMSALESKYSNSELQTARAEAKSGAAAFTTPEQVKKDNQRRYEQALQDKTTPDQLWKDISGALTKYMNWFQTKLTDITPKNAKDLNTKVKFGGWGQESLIRPINQMLRTIEDMSREYDYAMRDMESAEKYAEKIKDSDDDQKKLQYEAEVSYYAKSMDRYNKKAMGYRKEITQYVSDVDSIVKG